MRYVKKAKTSVLTAEQLAVIYLEQSNGYGWQVRRKLTGWIKEKSKSFDFGTMRALGLVAASAIRRKVSREVRAFRHTHDERIAELAKLGPEQLKEMIAVLGSLRLNDRYGTRLTEKQLKLPRPTLKGEREISHRRSLLRPSRQRMPLKAKLTPARKPGTVKRYKVTLNQWVKDMVRFNRKMARGGKATSSVNSPSDFGK